jgi:hypothetical protein
MARSRIEDAVESRLIGSVYIVFHPATGSVSTEPYEEKALARGLRLMEAKGGKAYIIEAAKITRIDAADKLHRLYKLERDRLDIQQDFI